MAQPKNTILAIIIWLIAETVLQIHGIMFWIEHGGWHGWIWSIALGLATVWFWLHRRRTVRIVLGTFTSLLLVAGPLYQVGAPLVDRVHQARAAVASIDLERSALQRSEVETIRQLETYLSNSQVRSGWAPIIEQVQQRLDTNRTRQAALAVEAAVVFTWLPLAVVVIQLLTLLLLQVAAITSLLVIRANVTNVTAHPKRSSAKRRNVTTGTVSADPKYLDKIKEQITAGEFSDKPAVRQVIFKTKIRHEQAKEIFGELVREGVLIMNGNRYQLKAC